MKMIALGLSPRTKQLIKHKLAFSTYNTTPYTQFIMEELYTKQESFKNQTNSDLGMEFIDNTYTYQI